MAQQSRSRGQWLFEQFGRLAMRLTFILVYRIRVRGRANYPRDGGGLICSNHQSFIDPVLVGLTFDRRMNYIARKTLFRFGIFAKWINFWDAIPIDQKGSGFGGIKESLRRLRRGELVLIFPEGSRTFDGDVQQMKPGFCALARRGKVPIIPIGIEGAFDAWPRGQLLPLKAVIHVCIGKPISVEEMKSLTAEELVGEVHRRIQSCHAVARSSQRRADK